jgi:hypothetical protein
MRELRHAQRGKRVKQTGGEAGARASGDFPDEQKHPEAGKDKGREKEQVVAEDEVVRQRIHGQDLDRLREEMLGIRQRERLRIKNVGVPEPPHRVQIA